MSELESVRWIASRLPCGPLVSQPAAGRYPRRAVNVAWSFVDLVLASRQLSNLVIAMASLGAAAVCVRAGGVDRLVENFPALAMIWGTAAGLIRLGRERRDLKPLAGIVPVVRWLWSGGCGQVPVVRCPWSGCGARKADELTGP